MWADYLYMESLYILSIRRPLLWCSTQCLDFIIGKQINIKDTVEPRCNRFQGNNNFFLLLADFCYYQKRKLKKLTRRDYNLVSVISEIPLVAGQLEQGLTVLGI